MALSPSPQYPYPPWDFTEKERLDSLPYVTNKLTQLSLPSFAYNTIVKRWPVIITNLIDTVHQAIDTESNGDADKISEAKAVISRLAKLKYDMSHDRPLERIPNDGGLNSEVYNARLDELDEAGKSTWMKIPWLFGECYLYRLFDSIFRATRHWSTFDPFFKQKEDTFRESGAAVHQLAKIMDDLDGRRDELSPGTEGWEDKLAIVFAEMVQMCLWGNATDLSMLPSMDPADVALLQAVGEDKAHLILRNDAGALWTHVRGLKDARLDFVLDNAGFELFTDFVFADFLVTYTPYASRAVFHPKPIPWFVSDVTPRDFSSIFVALEDPTFFTTLEKSSMQPDSLSKMVARWQAYVKQGVFKLSPESTHAFWVAPGGYWEIAPGRDGEEVGKLLDGSGLVIFKGDLNYRKLTGDIKWPNDTPWETAIGPVAGRFPLVSLRTCKADVVVGLGPGVAEKLDADPKEKGWRAGGK
ncbi:protein-glutamate O-methyltransferase C1393,13 [Ceratobasidium sp. AG-Ba]|nr:protein-glutamate O-methyltransferase C1393,13 [Ceratobasidium sp. AG-Ba]